MPEPRDPHAPDAELASARLRGLDLQRVREQGAALVTKLHSLLRAMQLYDPSNRALRAQLTDLVDALEPLMQDEVSLLGMGEYFYVNGLRLRPTGSQLAVFRALLSEFEARQISGLRFESAVKADEIESFLRVFHAHRNVGALAALETESARLGIRHVYSIRARMAAVMPLDEQAPAVEPDSHRVRLVFSRAVNGTRELMHQTARTGRPALRQARRVVQPIVDRLLREHSLVGLTALKRHDDYTYAHCVNVAILSLRMGQVLGLTRSDLANLGVAALLHDAGKVMVPADVLRKPGSLDAAEWEAIRRHPLEGVRIVSRLPGLSELMLDTMRVAFEHHKNIDHSGYPKASDARDMGAFSRIVAVADCFDAVTSHRSYRKRPMTAYEALRLLLGREQAHFDRAVLWALLWTVGFYPAGTLVRTRSDRLWLSLAPNPEDSRRPICRELFAGDPVTAAPFETRVPLPEDETVTHVLSPEEAAIDIEPLLAA